MTFIADGSTKSLKLLLLESYSTDEGAAIIGAWALLEAGQQEGVRTSGRALTPNVRNVDLSALCIRLCLLLCGMRQITCRGPRRTTRESRATKHTTRRRANRSQKTGEKGHEGTAKRSSIYLTK